MYPNRQGGLIKAIVIVVIILLILAYFGLNLRNIVGSSTFQDNWNFLWNGILTLWNMYLKSPAMYLWNIFVMYIWDPAIQNLMHNKAVTTTIVNQISSTSTPSIP